MKLIDLAGKRIGRLVVLSNAGYRITPNGTRRTLWLCRCDCGAEVTVQAPSLFNGGTRSCGCLMREKQRSGNLKHGHYVNGRATPERDCWNNIKARCYNTNNKHYADYGGRNITVCAEWRRSFARFFEDMGLRPSPDHSIDRVDNNGPYAKWNCRWATDAQQAANRRPRTKKPHAASLPSTTERPSMR